MRRRLVFHLILWGGLLAGAVFLVNVWTKPPPPSLIYVPLINNAPPPASQLPVSKPEASPPSASQSATNPTSALPQPINPEDVPFTSQAPQAQWSDPVYQNGCEEASLLMADRWARGVTAIGGTQAADEIVTVSSRAEKLFQTDALDTSADDTVKLGMDFYPSLILEAKHDIALQDIIETLNTGRLIIVPADGKSLGNPNFRPPGPERHMLVLIAYDTATHEFITNDPGTRLGQGYRYDKQVLFNAIRDYPTGHDKPITGRHKVMIVVGKK